MTPLFEIQQNIGKWHRMALNGATPLEIKAKVCEESMELLQTHTMTQQENEAADVAIALLAFCENQSIDLEKAIGAKMIINLDRKWTRVNGKWVREK